MWLQVQINKTPQITFGIKHSPLLGQLRPLEPRPSERTTPSSNTTKEVKVTQVQRTVTKQVPNQIENNKRVDHENVVDINETNQIYDSRAHVTQVRHDSEIRSTTVSPEPVQHQDTLTQEIVWIPEKPVRRGSYTIEKTDGNGFYEKYQNSDVIPVENGVIRTAEQGERGARCSEERSSEVIRRDGYEQNIEKNVRNATAHEQKQAATEEVRSNTDVQKLANGGISKTTTTTTIRKVGTAARTANETTAVTRTATVVTSRDIGVK